MVADRVIPIKYNSLLGYESQPYEDEYYYYNREESLQSFVASTEVIPLGLICHECSYEKQKLSLKVKKGVTGKGARKEKRRLMFKSKMMAAHYSFVEENVKELKDCGNSLTTAYLLVMVRKDTSSLYHQEDGEYFEGVCNYKIALMDMRKFRIVTDLEDFIFLDLEEKDGKVKKYFEMEGDFSRRNHYLVSFESDVPIEDDHHIAQTGVFTFIAEGIIVKFRLIMDRLEITNTRVLVEMDNRNSPLDRSSELLSGKFSIINDIFPQGLSKSTLTANNTQLSLFDLEKIEKKVFSLPPILALSKKSILTCDEPSHKGIYLISNSEIFSIGSNDSTISLTKEEALSQNLIDHFDGFRMGGVCKLTTSKYLILLEKSNDISGDEIDLGGIFENSKWIILDLISKTVSITRPTTYRTRYEENSEDGFTTVTKKRTQSQRHFLTNFGGELNGGNRKENEKLNLPKFAINNRSMYSYRPFRNNQDCFLVKTFLTSSKVDNHAFNFMKAEMLPVAHFTLYFHIKEESIGKLDRRWFSDLEIKTK